MDILVIGGSGFLGGCLLRQMLQAGKLPAATRLPRERIGIDGCEEYDLDVTNENALRRLLSEHRPQQIYHLAAQSSAALSRQNPKLTAEVNILGTLHLLEAVRSIPEYYPRILIAGSGEEYGTVRGRTDPLPEDTALRPDSVLGVTKAAQNMLGSVYARTYGMGIVMARTFSCIGPGQPPDTAVPALAMQVAEIEAGLRPPVMRAASPGARFDCLDVRDAASAYLLLMERGCAGETYNVGSGQPVSVGEIIGLLAELSRESIAVELPEQRPSACTAADTAKLREDTGWAPEYSLEETLHTMLNHCRRSIGI